MSSIKAMRLYSNAPNDWGELSQIQEKEKWIASLITKHYNGIVSNKKEQT